MPRKSTSKASATPKATPSEDTPTRRSGLRAPTAKQPAKEPATPASEPKRSRRSSTAAQTAASQAESKKTRSQSPDDDSNTDKSSPSSRSTRRPMRKVNYEESDGEEDNAEKPVAKEEDYNAEEDVENDSDSLESTSKKKGKVKSPTTPRNSRSRAQNSRSSKGSRSHKKKEVDAEEEEDAPATQTPSRRGRHSSEKANSQDGEEKPKGTTRSRRAAAAATPAASSTRPSRAAKQRKSTSTEEKAETPKPVRSSTRNRKKVEQEDRNEEMEEEEDEEETEEKDVEEPETNDEKEESKKRKLEVSEDEKDGNDNAVKKVKVDEEAPEDDDEAAEKSDNDEDKEAEKPEEKEEKDEEPMEVDSKDDLENNESVPSTDKENEVVEDENEATEDKEDEAQEPEEADTAEEDKNEAEDAKEEDQSDEKLDEKEEMEEPECEEPLEDSEDKVSEKETVDSKHSEDHDTSVNQNSPGPKQPPTKQVSPSTTAGADVSGESLAAVAEKPANSIPVVSSSPKATNCEPFQSSPIKSQDSMNGASPEEAPKSKSEPTQMLPSSAIELNQQQLVSTKPELETIRVSANGHVSDEKSSVDTTTNDCSSGLLHGRPYFPNRSPCAEALARHKERTFGLISLNLESTKVDDKFCLELKSFVSDIVCIQGISQELFTQQIEPSLNALGYKGTLAQDENQAVATFYKSSLFQLKGQKKLTLKQTIAKDLERSMTPGEVSAVAEKIPLCGQVLFTHLGLTQSTRAVVIANVLVPPSDVSIQALQMSCLAREAVIFVESVGTGTGVPLVFCGAFNMEQQEAAYQLLRDGYLSNEMIEALQSKKELKLPGRDEDTSLVNLLWKSFQHSTSGLKSCYSAVTGQELAVGSQGSARTSPDLIWFSSDSLTPIGVLEAPSNPTGHHLLLKANLAFNY